MRRQIIFIITLLITACSLGFAVAAESNVSLLSYMSSRKNPMTLTKRINSIAQNYDAIAQYRNPATALIKGNIVDERYTITLNRELGIMGKTIIQYRDKLLQSKAIDVISRWGNYNICQWLTTIDIVSLMSRAPNFIVYVQSHPMVTIEEFLDADMNLACKRRSACVWWEIYQQVQQYTSQKNSRPLCYTSVDSEVSTIYQTQLSQYTTADSQLYNSIFINGSWWDSVFDIMLDMNELASITISKTTPPLDSTQLVTTTVWDGDIIAYLPNELIASTQQLVDLLENNNSIDPRQDAQINALIGKLNTVSTSTTTDTVPTGSILNACVAPEAAGGDSNMIEQLRTTQQVIQQYNQSIDTDQALNNVINGSIDPSSFMSETIKLSSITTPSTTNKQDLLPVPDLSANPLWSALAKIDDKDMISWWDWWIPLSGEVSAVLWAKAWWKDSISVCLWSCREKYDNNEDSPCVIKCESKWQIWGALAARACNQQCFNAKIACQASCLCNSTTTINQEKEWEDETSATHKMFELRRCVIPTNKLNGITTSSCIRVDPKTWISKWPSIECLLDQTIKAWENAREWSKWWIRVNPKERFQLPNKFSLKNMIRFPINVVNAPIRDDVKKKRDIDKAKNKQTIVQDISQNPSLTATKVISDSKEVVNTSLQKQIYIWQSFNATSENQQWILEWAK